MLQTANMELDHHIVQWATWAMGIKGQMPISGCSQAGSHEDDTSVRGRPTEGQY